MFFNYVSAFLSVNIKSDNKKSINSSTLCFLFMNYEHRRGYSVLEGKILTWNLLEMNRTTSHLSTINRRRLVD